MKKIYSKPEIMFESFTLSENIAGDCEVKTNTPSQGTCAYGENDFGIPLFTGDVPACEAQVADGNDKFCYHVPLETNTLFNS